MEINARLHAYLFVSPDFSLRHDAAKKIAKQMLCRDASQKMSPCDNCPNCLKVQNETHPDCIYYGKNPEKVPVAEIRKISEQAYIAPNEADGKVFVLENVDMYTEPVQNALLKILEEPPKNVKFVLTASSKSGILQTVLSRVSLVSGEKRMFEQYLQVVKKQKTGIDDATSKSLAYFAMCYEGTNISETDENLFKQALDLSYDFFTANQKDVLKYFPLKREQISLYLSVFMLVAKEICVCSATGKNYGYLFDKVRMTECCSRCSVKRAIALYDVFEKAFIRLSNSANVNALFAYISQNIID